MGKEEGRGDKIENGLIYICPFDLGKKGFLGLASSIPSFLPL
jgi:hypothetical protein